MKLCWKGDLDIEIFLDEISDYIFVHPCEIVFLDGRISDWAKKNKESVDKLKFKNIIEQSENNLKNFVENNEKEINEFKKLIDEGYKKFGDYLP